VPRPFRDFITSYRSRTCYRILSKTSLGVSAIPEVWVIDTEGKVYSNDARGKLDMIVPGLLKRKNENK
jgi:hypothetical protein